jgi:lipopolysaccharide biosynthesis glycosyltransferase
MKACTKGTVPVFFATDDNYAPLLGVALSSLLKNANPLYHYRIHVLTTGLRPENKEGILREVTPNATLSFDDVSAPLSCIAGDLQIRDYYSAATYYRIFIGSLFPQYEKALYLDADVIFTGDVSLLYEAEIGDNLVGAVREDVMAMEKVFGDYARVVVGVPAEQYFNAGILLLNLKEYRAHSLEKRFISLLRRRKFAVAQDQDYLNVLCRGRVHFFDPSWNHTAVKGALNDGKKPNIVHYKMDWKPWHYDGVLFEELFWEYADACAFAEDIREIKRNYSPSEKLRDKLARERLARTAELETLAMLAETETSSEYLAYAM